MAERNFFTEKPRICNVELLITMPLIFFNLSIFLAIADILNGGWVCWIQIRKGTTQGPAQSFRSVELKINYMTFLPKVKFTVTSILYERHILIHTYIQNMKALSLKIKKKFCSGQTDKTEISIPKPQLRQIGENYIYDNEIYMYCNCVILNICTNKLQCYLVMDLIISGT